MIGPQGGSFEMRCWGCPQFPVVLFVKENQLSRRTFDTEISSHSTTTGLSKVIAQPTTLLVVVLHERWESHSILLSTATFFRRGIVADTHAAHHEIRFTPQLGKEGFAVSGH